MYRSCFAFNIYRSVNCLSGLKGLKSMEVDQIKSLRLFKVINVYQWGSKWKINNLKSMNYQN